MIFATNVERGDLMAKTLVYQLYPLSWETGFEGMIKHLSRVARLGADYVWLSPVYDSPFEDGGYDVSNYKRIHRRFERKCCFHEFVEKAHNLGLGVIMDLPLNHTSTRHRWFSTHPEYYCWSRRDYPKWHNLFDNGSAWCYQESEQKYYLHLFHSSQADLNWFPESKPSATPSINQRLVQEFRAIIEYWLRRGIDGFRLDFPQGLNKDFSSDSLNLEDLLFGNRAIEVINAIFKDHEDIMLMMECFDPTMGELVEYYAKNTSINFVCNVMLKDEIRNGESNLLHLIDSEACHPNFMLELESHDSPRFPSRGVEPKDMVLDIFGSSAEGVCLYQGQELGLKNPSKEKLPDDKLLELDVQTAMRYIKGEDIDHLRPLSRANTRVRLPLKEYTHQEQDPDSCLNYTKCWIQRWRITPNQLQIDPRPIHMED